MKTIKEQFIKSMLDKKADEDKIIDLNAYKIGLEEMYEALNSHFFNHQCELLAAYHKFLDWEKKDDEGEIINNVNAFLGNL